MDVESKKPNCPNYDAAGDLPDKMCGQSRGCGCAHLDQRHYCPDQEWMNRHKPGVVANDPRT